MGNSSKNPEDYDIVRNYRAQEWELSSTLSPPQLWRNRKTHELAEIYRLYSIPSIQDMNRYEMRSTQQYFVKVYHIALSPNQAMCFNQEYVRVLIEYIPVKLQNVSGLELQQALTILVSVFKGFNALSNFFGLVEPQQQLIGFNQWGKTKVWLNKQHNNNFPSQQSLSNHLDKSRVQASHVRKIFDLVQRKTQIGQLPIPLKQLFRLNNPNYLQASLIVEQFAYQNLLSLQRFIRTDLYTRKSSIHASNHSNFDNQLRYLRGSSNQKTNTRFISSTQAFPKPQLKRIHSVDALHTQRLTSHSQSTVSFTLPFKQNINHISGIISGHHQVRTSIPRIHFQRSSQSGSVMPFLNHSTLSNNIKKVQIRTPFTKQTTQHIKCISILSPHVQSPSVEKIQQTSVLSEKHLKAQKEPEFEHQQPVEQFLENAGHLNENQKQERQNLSLQVEQPKIESNIIISPNQDPNIQGGETCRSIIDKVENEMSEQIQNAKQEDSSVYQQRDEQIQVSGTFNYKALYDRDNVQNLHQPLEQIGEEDYSKDREEESKIKQPEEQYKNQEEKQENNVQDQQQNMPINFQSFAPTKLLQNQFISFAPNQISLPTQESIHSEENVGTSKSFQYVQNEKNNPNSFAVQSLEQIQMDMAAEASNQTGAKNAEKKVEPQYNRDLDRILQAKKRVSIDLYYPQSTQNPFYEHCTPVQSKFDVVIKRDSYISQESQRHERPSAFAHLDTDEQIQNYVRNKYLGKKDDYHQKIKVGRVESTYEKHYVKEPQAYDFAKKELPKKPIERENNRPYLRPTANNKISNILQKPEQDFLDVNFLQKSLDKRYSSNIQKAMKKKQEGDQLNIAKLDEGLMKFSTSKASLTQKSSKDDKYFQQVEPKVDYKNQYFNKWQISTGFEYQSKVKQSSDIDHKKKKKSVRIDNIPTHQFNYQLSSSDYGNFKGFSKQSSKSPFKQTSPSSNQTKSKYSQTYKIGKPEKITELQKQNLDARYNKYVKNSSKIGKIPKTPSINQIMSIKGDSRLMLSPIPEKRFEDEGRLSYDQLRSFLWG